MASVFHLAWDDSPHTAFGIGCVPDVTWDEVHMHVENRLASCSVDIDPNIVSVRMQF